MKNPRAAMITLDTPELNYSTLLDFALGRLTPERSLAVLKELERNPRASRDLEFILKLLNYFSEHGDEPHSAAHP